MHVPTVRRTLDHHELLANSGYTSYIVICSRVTLLSCDLDQLAVKHE